MTNTACLHRCSGEKGREYFHNGYHCAEAVASAVLEAKGVDPSQAVAHATPFGGGIGKSFGETCGALSGGLIAIGHLHGRSEPGVPWDTPATMGNELRERFLMAYRTTGCGVLRDRFGEEQMTECGLLVARIVEETLRVLEQR